MRTKYPIHSDFKKWSKMNPPLNRAVLPLIKGLLSLLFYFQKSKKTVKVSKYTITTKNRKIKSLLYTPKNITTNAPCLVYYHGGGFVLPAALYHYKLARIYAKETNYYVFFINYRLAPKYPFPYGVNDCYDAYEYISKHAEELGINPNKIIVGGDSAGGNLAITTCLKARDNNITMPCAQMLIYPVTGKDLETDSIKRFTDTPMCNSKDMKKYSKLYYQGSTKDDKYISPINATSFVNMPKAYIETAEFDCLHDEAILYAEKLKEFNINTQVYNTKGTIHGYDIVLKSSIVKHSINQRIEFLKMR